MELTAAKRKEEIKELHSQIINSRNELHYFKEKVERVEKENCSLRSNVGDLEETLKILR